MDIARAVHEGAAFLTAHQVRMLPVDPIALAAGCGWRVKPYTKMADKLQLSLGEVIETYGTQDAFTVYRQRPVIFYNDTVRSRERMTFSLCHEIGHIVLGHFSQNDAETLTDEARKTLDREAHAFACSMMAPAPIVKAAVSSIHGMPRKLFGMSQSAWEVRLATLEHDLALLGDSNCAMLTEHFAPWLQSLRCAKCGVIHEGRICPACGCMRPLPPARPAQARWEACPLPRKGQPMLEMELDNPMAE